MAERVFKMAYRWSIGSLISGVCTFHAGCETDASDAATIANAWDSGLQAVMRGCLPDASLASYEGLLIDLTATQVPLTSVPMPTPAQAVKTLGIAGTRTITEADLDPALCARVQWTTGVAGRRARGGSFLPSCLARAETAAGGLFTTSEDTYFERVQDFAEQLRDHAFSDGVQPVVYSKVAALADAANVWFHITDFKLTNRQHWLRSRTVLRG